MVQVVVVGVLVEMGQRHAVELGIGQGVDNVGLQPFQVLEHTRYRLFLEQD